MKKLAFSILILTSSILIFQACKKDKSEDADKILYNEATENGFSYYMYGNRLDGTPPSPHGAFKLRFNAIALAALDSTGELPIGSSFPDGSMLVKEVYDGSVFDMFVIMKKDPSNAHANKGWVWAELKRDGTADYSISQNGNDCVGCHKSSPNRDLTRTFDLH